MGTLTLGVSLAAKGMGVVFRLRSLVRSPMSTMATGKRIESMVRGLTLRKHLTPQKSTNTTESGTKDTSKARGTSSRESSSIQVPGSKNATIRMGSWSAARRTALEATSMKVTGS
jgi:hypothetical protein